MTDKNDIYDLSRFVDAQSAIYQRVVEELQAGRKRSHWMWFIFPQLEGLGVSATARHYSIKSLDEARAYLAHPVLGPRLRACAEAVVAVQGLSAHEIFGSPDDMKLRSCATLFSRAEPGPSVFEKVLEKYYQGQQDERTLAILQQSG